MARDFDGANDSVSCGTTNVPIGEGNRTTFCWLIYEGAGGTLIACNASTGQKYHFQMQGSSNPFIFTDGVNANNNFQLPTAEAPTKDEWHNIALTFLDGTGWEYFRDGVSRISKSEITNINTNTLTNVKLGERDDFGQDYDGKIFYGCIWDVQLTDNELAALGNGVNPFPIRNASLQLFIPNWGNQDPEPDYTRNTNSGTVTGATAYRPNPPAEHIENYLS